MDALQRLLGSLTSRREISGLLMQHATSDAKARNTGDEDATAVVIAGSGATQGARTVPSEDVDRAFGMPPGKLRGRAGIESLAYVAENENELTLGQAAARQALCGSGLAAGELDWIIATSETHHNYPSLAAQLHAGLVARENCAALDVGGGCMGLLNAFAVAQSVLAAGVSRTVAVVSADVHSRSLTPGRVAGEFGGLFGDGASAFVLRSGGDDGDASNQDTGYVFGEFLFGCVGQYASAVSVSDDKEGGLTLRFDGEALSRAAITRIEKTITAVEQRSGIRRANVAAFATHQPNPRLMALVARQCNVPESAFPEVARKAGNLGASTCGTALHLALEEARKRPVLERRPIFLASLGPGLLFGGGWAHAR